MLKQYLHKIKIITILIILWFSFSYFSVASDQKKWMIGLDYGIGSLVGVSGIFSYQSFQASYSLRRDNSIIINFGLLNADIEPYYFYPFLGIKKRWHSDKRISPFLQLKLLNFWIGGGMDFNISLKTSISLYFQSGFYSIYRRPIGIYILSTSISYRL